MVDACDSKSHLARGEGSSPSSSTVFSKYKIASRKGRGFESLLQHNLNEERGEMERKPTAWLSCGLESRSDIFERGGGASQICDLDL